MRLLNVGKDDVIQTDPVFKIALVVIWILILIDFWTDPPRGEVHMKYGFIQVSMSLPIFNMSLYPSGVAVCSNDGRDLQCHIGWDRVA